jgi:hypothetical protein
MLTIMLSSAEYTHTCCGRETAKVDDVALHLSSVFIIMTKFLGSALTGQSPSRSGNSYFAHEPLNPVLT